MESLLTKQKPREKRLNELLQEQQEPFRMDVYLMERGYLKKILDSKSISGLKRRKGTTLLCPQILKTVLNKLVSSKGRRATRVSEFDNFSPASSVTVYESCSDDMEDSSPSSKHNQTTSSCSDAPQDFQHQMTVVDKADQCGCLEDSKQSSPVSVLEEIPCDEVSPLRNHMRCCSRSNKKETQSTSKCNQPRRVTEEAIFSASLWDLLERSELRELLETSSDNFSLSRKTKRVLEQKKQLLFDCVREVLESHGNNKQKSRFLGGEEMGKLIGEQICSWATQNANVKNLSYMINSDFWKGTQDWGDCKPQRMKIGIEISDFILEEMEREIVLDIIECS